MTITYPLEAEAQIIKCLAGFPTYDIEDLINNIAGTPDYIRIHRSAPIR